MKLYLNFMISLDISYTLSLKKKWKKIRECNFKKDLNPNVVRL